MSEPLSNVKMRPKEMSVTAEGPQYLPIPMANSIAPWRITAGIAATNPRLRYLFDPQASRPATEAETAQYAARRDDPDWNWLFILAGEKQPDPDAHPYPDPGTEAAPLPGDAPAEDGPDGTRVIPAVSAETEIVPAVAEEDGGPQS
jgi:hypothetical protein